MPHYLITVRRTELITFAIEATDPADANDRFLRDGEEVGADTVGFEVETVLDEGTLR